MVELHQNLYFPSHVIAVTKCWKLRLEGHMELLGKTKVHKTSITKPGGITSCGRLVGRMQLNLRKLFVKA